MYSKILKAVAAFGLFAALVGCELPLNETPPESKPIEVSLGEATGCLSRVPPVLKEYFAGTAQPAQIEATWNCMATAVETFESSVQGRYEDRFTAREVAHFIEQYFLEDNERLPDALVVEVFRIKQLFVGGAIDSISRVEMKNLNGVISEMKRITLNLNPYMSVFSKKWDSSSLREVRSNSNHFELANAAIQQGAKDLAILIEKNGLPYRLEYVTNLLHQFDAFNNSGWTWVTDVEKAIPLVKKLKKALAGGSEDEIAPTEWRRFALLGARGYIQYLRYHYFVKSVSLSAGGSHIFYFTQSISDLFSYLGDMVSGKPNQMLERSELVEILQAASALIPELKVSDQLVSEFMRIKVVFFGGRIDFFVKADFDRAQGKLQDFQELMERFLKYKDVYGLSWKPENMSLAQAKIYFELAEESLKDCARILGANMDDAYNLQNLISLAEELEKLYPTTEPEKTSLLEMAQKYVPAVVAIKNILFSDHDSVVGAAHSTLKPSDQWKDFLNLAAQGYSRYMFYDYFLKDKKWTEGSGLESFRDLVEKSMGIINGLISRKQAGAISFIEINNLWGAILKTDVLPKKVTRGTLENLTKVVLQKMLVPYKDRLAGVVPSGLSKVTTDYIMSEFLLWRANQKFLDIVYTGIPSHVGKPGSEILRDLGNAAPTPANELAELKMIYDAPMTMSFDEVGRLHMAQPPKDYLRKTSNMINLLRTVVKVAIGAYAMEAARIESYQGVTLKEAQTLYADVKPLVVELEFIHPKNVKFPEDRFRDANLFTSVSDGDDYANFRELNHLFLMIISGLKVDSMMFDKMEHVCRVTKPTEYHDDWLADLICVIDFYWAEMPGAFAAMPDFMAYQATMDKTRFQGVFMNLLKSTGHKETGTGKVHIGDLSLVPHVIQYVEGFFQMYDTDRNASLNTAESLKAFPTFKAILQKVSGLKTEKELKGLFGWMLRYGKPPQSAADKIKFATWWVGHEERWNIEANREKLATILAFIAEAMESAGSAETGGTSGTETGAGGENPPVENPGSQPDPGSSGEGSGVPFFLRENSELSEEILPPLWR